MNDSMPRIVRPVSLFICAIAASLALPATAAELRVSTQPEYEEAVKVARPGDTIVLAKASLLIVKFASDIACEV